MWVKTRTASCPTYVHRFSPPSIRWSCAQGCEFFCLPFFCLPFFCSTRIRQKNGRQKNRRQEGRTEIMQTCSGRSVRGRQYPFLTVSAVPRHLDEVCAAIERGALDIDEFSAGLTLDLIASAAFVDRQPSLVGAAGVAVLDDLRPVSRRA